MEDFRIIYRILKNLQKSMDLEEIDKDSISSEALKISEPRWCRIVAMLIHEGYITGAETWNSMTQSYPRVALTRPEITLKGLEYLQENSLMKKAANLARGIVETVTDVI